MELFDWSLVSSTIRMVTPILLAALGGALCSRVGIFNVGLEGLILVGAFSAIVGNHFTGSLLLALLFAALVTVLFSLLFAYMTIGLRANEIVVGVAINFLGLGLTTFALRAVFDVKGAFYDKDMAGLPQWQIPLIKDIPVLGDIISGHSPLVYFAFLAAVLLHFFFTRTVTGFRALAVGMNATAARSLGLKATRLQVLAIVMCGVLCGMAGAQLSLGQVTMFTEGMTAGRGFIALVAMMLGQAHPLGILASSFLFGLMDALSIRLQGFSLPTQFTAMLPYVLTIAAMFFLKDKGASSAGSSQQSTR
ncbi:ABC transporter permease [Brevibacillus borstelensis]|jgi:simple sugar transport system permease protein|uniref:ABC transporter permease n=1 Tax=Brevibacillus borstelensis TaxID=45462 RepID=UPI000F08A297|nr:ABC transporter permease [Brevibacillus borstelensis]MED1742880.1 ABC transporter permease [Brevibacillus borstelensis]MED1881542.1 ABC transporter permease [Brevibacillus borstelensis]NOU53827.1 ABC transporter permease [Brevibacillus borstelensis]RNB64452.1 ABC transporter permease [Brevibacillus borstelensis]WNF06101.1 ABC transporter permease [Brevibacillus borstelensis]